MTSPAALDVAELYRRLLDAYGPQGWWPAEQRFEMMVGAVLVQNTAWRNVEPAIAALAREGLLEPHALAGTPLPLIEGCIRSSGTFRVKARRIHALARFVVNSGSLAALDQRSTAALRADLLAVHGIGEETADAILCYAFNRACFVLDAYTRRLCMRLGVTGEGTADAEIRKRFHESLADDPGVFGECHALIVAHAKAHCRARPLCGGCPLGTSCQFNGSRLLVT